MYIWSVCPCQKQLLCFHSPHVDHPRFDISLLTGYMWVRRNTANTTINVAT